MTPRVKKRVVLLLTALVVTGGAVAGAYSFQQVHIKNKVAQSLREGTAAFEAGDFKKAFDDLGYVAGNDQKNEQVYLMMARARKQIFSENRRHLIDAIRLARKASELAPSDPAPLELLLELNPQVGFVNEQVRDADALLALKKDHHDALEAKVIALEGVGKFDKAKEAALALASAHPDDVIAHRQVVALMSRLHEPNEKQREYADQVAAAHKDQLRFAVFQAQIHAMTGDSAGALAMAKAAAELPSKTATDVSDLLQVLDIMSRTDASLSTLADKVLDREVKGPFGADVSVIAGERAWKLGRPEEARKDAAHGVDPSNLSKASDAALGWWTFLGLAGGGKPEGPELAAALAELKKRHTPSGFMWTDIAEGMIALNAGKVKDAQEAFQQAETADPKNTDVPEYLLGDVDQRLGEWHSAVIRWQRLSRQEPTWRVVHISTVTLLLQHGQFDEAIEQAEAAFSVRSTYAEAVTLARALALAIEAPNPRRETIDRALVVAQGLEKEGKDEPTVQSLIARIYLAGGKQEQGEAIARKLLDAPATPPDVLSALAMTLRNRNQALSDQMLAKARSVGDTPELVLMAALQLADAGKPADGRDLLQKAVDTHKGPGSLPYDLRLAGYLDRTKDAGAAAAFAKIAADHEDEPMAQLALLDSDSSWKDEAVITSAINRLHQLTGEKAVAWKLYEARRLLAFKSTQDNAASAVKLLADALRSDPTNVGAMVLSAEAQLVLGDRAKAIEEFAQAVDADPARPTIYPRLIELLQQAGRSDDAGRRLLSFSNINPLPTEVLRQRAKLMAAQGMWDQAVADFSELAKKGNVEDKFSLGVSQARKGDAGAAAATLNEVLNAKDLSEPLVLTIAGFYAGQGQIDRGREIIEQRLPASAADRKTAVLAEYLDRYGRAKEAEQQFREQAKDGKPESIAALARFLYKHTRVDEAKKLATDGLAANPGNTSLKQVLAFIDLGQGGKNKQAMADIAASFDSLEASAPLRRVSKALQALEEHPNDVAAYMDTLEDITKSDPGFFPAWRLLVEAKFQRGDIKEALTLARIAARSNPADPRPARLATEVLTSAGQYEEALAMAQQWRQRAINDPYDADTAIVIVDAAMKRYDDALRVLDPWKSRIVAEAETSPDHLKQYATVLASAGRITDAQDLVWPRAEHDTNWALRCLRITEGLPAPAQEQWLAKLQPLLDKSPTGRLQLGRVMFQIASARPTDENYNRAIDMLKGALDDTASRAGAALFLAGAYQARNNKDEAVRYYRMAIEGNPDDAAALNNLAYLLADSESTCAEAATMAQKAVDVATRLGLAAPVRQSMLDTLGGAQLKCKQYDKAADTYRKALALDPSSLGVSIGLAEASLALNSDTEAKAAVQLADSKGLAVDPSLKPRLDALRVRIKGK